MKNSNKINITLVILAVLIFVFGGYVLFFKGKGNPSIANEKIIKEAIEFKSIARGEYGNLYLDLDGKVYFEPFSTKITNPKIFGINKFNFSFGINSRHVCKNTWGKELLKYAPSKLTFFPFG